jgi:prophage antirepressor-like protein
MTDYNQASSRVNKAVGDTTERLEKEAAEFIKYLNDEVVPAIRQHSTKALRTAAEKMTELANYMEKHSTVGK